MSELKPVDDDLPAEGAALAAALRDLFTGLGVSTRRYAARRSYDPSTVSRYLSGRRLPPWEFTLGLLHDVAEERRTLPTTESIDMLRALHTAALQTSNRPAHRVQRLEQELAEVNQEARQNPIRADDPAERESAASSETIASSPILARLLIWLDAHAQQRPAEYVNVTQFVDEFQMEDEDPTVLALQLEQRGLADIARNLAGTPDVHLTDEGRVAVYRLKKLQQDRAARLRYTMDAFVRWLFDTAGDQTPVDPTLFLMEHEASFAGADIPGADVHQALAYLAERDLIEHIDTNPASVAITPQGVSHVLSGQSVHERTRGSLRDTRTPVRGVLSGEGRDAAHSAEVTRGGEARFPVLRPDVRITPAPQPSVGALAGPPAHGQDNQAEARVVHALGDPKAYLRESRPHPDSNQADVFKARHKATGLVVAVKQLRQKAPGGMKAARMRREIDCGKALAGHPHAMPILDHAANYTWFVMPWAEATASDHLQALADPTRLRALVDALTSVLAKAHDLGWVHRDIKPPNILLWEGRWVLADWGTVRRPAGQTTKVDRTRAGIGTEGFSAPELFTHPDERPQPCSDIYSIGRMIAWALTGTMPLPNKQLLPAPGPWRNIVRAATQEDPSRRPQSVSDLVALIEREHAEIPADSLEKAAELLEQANSGDSAAADAFLALLTDHTDDFELYAVQLPLLAAHLAAPALGHSVLQAQTVLQALTEHVGGADTRRVEYAEASQVTVWLQGVAAHAAAERQWDLLEEAMQAMCTWDGAWDRWDARDIISPWLGSLKDEAAAVAAAVLRDHPDSAEHFSHFADDRTVDPRIRRAVRQV